MPISRKQGTAGTPEGAGRLWERPITEEQRRMLAAAPPAEEIFTTAVEGRPGEELRHLRAGYVMRRMTEVFGVDGWRSEVEPYPPAGAADGPAAMVGARCRVSAGGTSHEDVCYVMVGEDRSPADELNAAATLAFKRAVRRFGNAFGLGLYPGGVADAPAEAPAAEAAPARPPQPQAPAPARTPARTPQAPAPARTNGRGNPARTPGARQEHSLNEIQSLFAALEESGGRDPAKAANVMLDESAERFGVPPSRLTAEQRRELLEDLRGRVSGAAG